MTDCPFFKRSFQTASTLKKKLAKISFEWHMRAFLMLQARSVEHKGDQVIEKGSSETNSIPSPSACECLCVSLRVCYSCQEGTELLTYFNK